MEENVFYVSSWHTWNCECSELVLTFSQTFCLKTNVRSHSVPPFLNCQILLTSLFPEECKCILFPPRCCRVPAACQCKQFPSLPRRRAPAGMDAGSVLAVCQGLSLQTSRVIWCCTSWRWALCFPSPGFSSGLHPSPWKRVQHRPGPWGHLLVGTPCLVSVAASFGWWFPRPTRFYLESSIFCKSESHTCPSPSAAAQGFVGQVASSLPPTK